MEHGDTTTKADVRDFWGAMYRSAYGDADSALDRETLLRLLDAIDSGQEAPHSARDNLKTMALLEACYQSAAEKRRVEI